MSPTNVDRLASPALHPHAAEGVFGSGSSLAIFKHDANESAILFNPTGLLYLRNDPAAPDSSSGGLSGAAVAGIAVGSTVAAAAMAGLLAAALLRHRRRRRALGAPKAYASLSSSTVLPVAVIGGPGPSHSLSAELASHTASADPAHADSPFAAAAAVVPAFDPAPDGPAAPTAMQPRAGSTAPRPAAGPALHLAASSALLDGPGSGPPETVPELVQLVAAADVAASRQPGAAPAAAAGASGGSRSSGSGEAAARLPPPAAILPAALLDHVVDPAAIEYCRLPSGKLHVLGEGARWAAEGGDGQEQAGWSSLVACVRAAETLDPGEQGRHESWAGVSQRCMSRCSRRLALCECSLDTFTNAHPAAHPSRSGRVFKAKLRGEIIAVKEIDLGASEANRRTFLTVSALRTACSVYRRPVEHQRAPMQGRACCPLRLPSASCQEWAHTAYKLACTCLCTCLQEAAHYPACTTVAGHLQVPLHTLLTRSYRRRSSCPVCTTEAGPVHIPLHKLLTHACRRRCSCSACGTRRWWALWVWACATAPACC